MSNARNAGTYTLGDRTVNRMGYGAMQLAGPHVFGPPKDPQAAAAVLREALAAGVNHIDTSDFYGPHVTNRLIRDTLHPYAEDLTLVTKVGAARGGVGVRLAEDDQVRRLGVLRERMLPASIRGGGRTQGSQGRVAASPGRSRLARDGSQEDAGHRSCLRI